MFKPSSRAILAVVIGQGKVCMLFSNFDYYIMTTRPDTTRPIASNRRSTGRQETR